MAEFMFVTFMLCLAALNGYKMFQKRYWRDLAVYAAIWLFGLVYGVLNFADIRVISPNEIIINGVRLLTY